MMRKILIFILGSFTVLLHAQGNIGVATTSPRANLDVNGDLNIGKKIFLDNGSGVLLAGKENQLLVSRGPNNPPTWKTLRIPEYLAGNYYLIFNDSFKDFNAAATTGGQGISFTDSETAPTTLEPSTDFAVNTPLSSLTANGFKTISGLSKNFTVNSTVSSTYFMFETVVQQNNPGGASDVSNIKFACGIFVDGLLKSIRINMLPRSSSSSTFITHTQIGGVENLLAGTHSINVACARLTNPASGITLGVGVPSYVTQNTNNFMTQSSLKVDVYEIPQNFSSVIIP